MLYELYCGFYFQWHALVRWCTLAAQHLNLLEVVDKGYAGITLFMEKEHMKCRHGSF